MNDRLKEFFDENEQSNFPQFLKEMKAVEKVKGPISFYSKKHQGSQKPSDYYKPISLITNNEDLNSNE